MSGCGDKRFEDMLYAYELGMLDEKDRLECELHLYNCESCFEKVRKFQPTARLLRESQCVKDRIGHLADEETRQSQVIPLERKDIQRKKRLWPTLIPVSIAAIFFLFLILKDWHIEIYPSHEAIAAKNRIAIMYFENLVDPGDSLRFGEIAASLLMADLSESQYINIVSSQRLYDILKLLDQEGTKVITRETASQIAVESKADWILMGNILQTSPNIVLMTQIIEVGTGDIIASQQMTGGTDEDIFSVIDRLTVEIKESLKLPSDAMMEPDPRIADYTSHSATAYRYYLEGIEEYNKLYRPEAQASFEKALEYDSTLAMAYYYLANIKDGELIHKAIEYAKNAGTIDRLYIKAYDAAVSKDFERQESLLKEIINRYPDEKNAYYLLGLLYQETARYHEAVSQLTMAIDIDPKFKLAYNQLAYARNAMGEFEKALWAIDKYIELAPGEANPLDTKAEIYGLNGMIDNAIESYKRALSIKPDYYASLQKLGLMYIFKQDYRRADSCLDIMQSARDINYRKIAARYKSFIPLFQGRLDDALGILDSLLNVPEYESSSNHFVKMVIYIELKDWPRALVEINKAIELHQAVNPGDKTSYRYFRIHVIAESGNIPEAIERMKELKADIDKGGQIEYPYWYAVGCIEMAQGNYERARASFEKARDLNNLFFINYMLAKNYFLAEEYEKTITELEKIRDVYGVERSYYGVWSAKLYYILGLAYEKTGHTDKAIEQYKVFLGIWKNADPELNEVKDARERLARLENHS